MSLTSHAIKQSISLALRGLPQLLISYALLKSNEQRSIDYMYLFQQIPNIATLFFSVFLSGYIIKLKEEKYDDYKFDLIGQIIVLAAILANFYSFFEIQIFLYFFSINFRNTYFRLKNTGASLIIPIATTLMIIFIVLLNFDITRLLGIWLMISTIIYCIPENLQLDINWSKTTSRIIYSLPTSYKQSVLTILLISVFVVERHTVMAIDVSEQFKKEFLFSLSFFNAVTLVGSGALAVIGPKYIEKDINTASIRKTFAIVLIMQTLICLSIIGFLSFYFDNKGMTFLYFLKSVTIIALYYFQSSQQKLIFQGRIVEAIKNASLMFIIWAPLTFLMSYKAQSLFYFYILVILSSVIATIKSWTNFRHVTNT